MTDRGEGRLTASTIDELTDEYEREEPFDLVEREHTKTLPPAFTTGDFGRRDAEWVVQWYYRRLRWVGVVSDADRRAAESQFLENDYEAMADAIQDAATAETLDAKLDSLTALVGVDVAVASAFLAFTQPNRYVPVDSRAWGALHAAGELDASYPADLTPTAYETYLDTVRSIADRTDRSLWTVYRALWRRGD